MSETSQVNLAPPFVASVFHPSDFSEASEVAFVHALAIALVRQTKLVILHAGGSQETDWSRFPRVRQTLERWGVLEPGSPRSAVFDELSMRVGKIDATADAAKASFEYIKKNAPDLVVLATGGRDGVARWLQPSLAQKIARGSGAMTLFVPAGAPGFVDVETGRISLRRILIPVDHSPDPSEALVYATRAAERIGDPTVQIDLLHVGDGSFPNLTRPSGDGEAWRFSELRAEGDVVDAIQNAARDADLIVMATDGRDGVLDVFRGSNTERVVRVAPCPLLAVPAL